MMTDLTAVSTLQAHADIVRRLRNRTWSKTPIADSLQLIATRTYRKIAGDPEKLRNIDVFDCVSAGRGGSVSVLKRSRRRSLPLLRLTDACFGLTITKEDAAVRLIVITGANGCDEAATIMSFMTYALNISYAHPGAIEYLADRLVETYKNLPTL